MNGRPLPSEALNLAKRFGVNLEGFEAEAEEIWKKLDNMASNDPLQYQSFIEEQYKANKEQEGDPESSKPSYSFRPKAGFSIETRTVGGDGVKVRDLSSEGTKLFINFCSHDAIEAPSDQFGVIVQRITSSHGLQIPLVVGPHRVVEAEATKPLAVDVILNQAVIEFCSKYQTFKQDVVNLALEWIPKETDLKLKSLKWQDIPSPYVGGRGTSNACVLFFVDEQNEKKKQMSHDALQDPTHLVKEVLGQRDESISFDRVQSDPRLKPLMAEAGSKSKSTIKETAPSLPPSKPKPAIKKGFLNSSKVQLYPSGSSEGTSENATGGSFARVMDKCKVINMGPNGVQSQSVPAAAPSQVQTAATSAKSSAEKGLQESVSRSAEPSPSSRRRGPTGPTSQEEAEMDALMGCVDEEWSEQQRLDAAKHAADEFGAFADLAKLLIGENTGGAQGGGARTSSAATGKTSMSSQARSKGQENQLAAPATVRDSPAYTVTHDLPANSSVAVQVQEQKGTDDSSFVVRVISLGDDCKASDLELNVAVDTIELSFKESGRRSTVTVRTHEALNCNSSKASFSKKKRTITAQIGLL